MKRKAWLQKAVLLWAGALALPFCLGAGSVRGAASAGLGERAVLVDPRVMIPGPDAPTPEQLPITPLPGFSGELPAPEEESPLLPVE